MKYYEISVKAVAKVFVAEAKDEEEAIKFARQDMNCGDFEDIEMEAHELTSDMDIASSRSHADVKSEA